MSSLASELLEPRFNQGLRAVSFMGLKSSSQQFHLFTFRSSADGHVLGVEFHVAGLDAFGRKGTKGA